MPNPTPGTFLPGNETPHCQLPAQSPTPCPEASIWKSGRGMPQPAGALWPLRKPWRFSALRSFFEISEAYQAQPKPSIPLETKPHSDVHESILGQGEWLRWQHGVVSASRFFVSSTLPRLAAEERASWTMASQRNWKRCLGAPVLLPRLKQESLLWGCPSVRVQGSVGSQGARRQKPSEAAPESVTVSSFRDPPPLPCTFLLLELCRHPNFRALLQFEATDTTGCNRLAVRDLDRLNLQIQQPRRVRPWSAGRPKASRRCHQTRPPVNVVLWNLSNLRIS